MLCSFHTPAANPVPTAYLHHHAEPDKHGPCHQPISQQSHFLPVILSRNSSVEEKGVILIEEVGGVSKQGQRDSLSQSGTFSKAWDSFCFISRAALSLKPGRWKPQVFMIRDKPLAVCTFPFCHLRCWGHSLWGANMAAQPFVESMQPGMDLVPLVFLRRLWSLPFKQRRRALASVSLSHSLLS